MGGGRTVCRICRTLLSIVLTIPIPIAGLLTKFFLGGLAPQTPCYNKRLCKTADLFVNAIVGCFAEAHFVTGGLGADIPRKLY